jgi:deoxyribodipyrimidine photo-lyase
MMQKVNLFWFRRDLRLDDNTGLYHALQAGLPVVPVFIFDKDILDHLEDRNDKRVHFIYHALLGLQKILVKEGTALIVRYGTPENVLQQLMEEYAIQTVFTNHDYEPYAIDRDARVASLLQKAGVAFQSFKDQVIFEKDEVAKPDGTLYQVFTPYSKKWKSQLTPDSYESFDVKSGFCKFLKREPQEWLALSAMGFQEPDHVFEGPNPDKSIIEHYHTTRNVPSVAGTSRLGVHLRFGTISIRKLVQLVLPLNETFLNELIWREFFMSQLWQMPYLVNKACKPQYDSIRWRNDTDEFALWCQGKTGFPIVDAGMRELNETGFMHNRVRMIVASFLVKDLLIDWRWGEAYFAGKLMDYELASNVGNWQWVAGCGCDAAPYFRVFSPEAQAQKFDKDERYIRRWIPEYGTKAYPNPMLDHKEAARRCLMVFKDAVATLQV